MSGAAVELLPAGSFDPAYIGRVVAELESRGWQPDSRGEPDCADEASAAGADIIREYSAELQQCREALRKLVDLADTQPFAAIGHLVEHVVPEVRAALKERT